MADVIVYSSNSCAYCTLAKDYLNEKGVKFVEKNIQTDPEARKELMAMGHMGVPVIVIEGQEIVGFDKAKMDTLLGK